MSDAAFEIARLRAALAASEARADAAESELAQRFFTQMGLAPQRVRYESASRTTFENARFTAQLPGVDKTRPWLLLTSAWHMPRAQMAFERAGFTVVPAPTGFTLPQQRSLLEWLPTGHGLQSSREVLREWLGLRVAKPLH